MNINQRAYLPQSAYSNQYILAEIKPTSDFYQAFGGHSNCYETLQRLFFRLAEDAGLSHVYFIANDKLPVVRYYREYLCFQTERQMLIFYHPQFHEAQNAYFKHDYAAKKIRLLFLAAGEGIRANSADFHKRVQRLLTKFKAELPDSPIVLKVRDHQHLSYLLFSRDKGDRATFAHKLRALNARYERRHCHLPQPYREMNYVTATLPLSRQLKRTLQLQGHNYQALYDRLANTVFAACEQQQVLRCAIVANGKTPLVRHQHVDSTQSNSELQKVSFDPVSDAIQRECFIDAEHLAENIHLIMVAGEADEIDRGYARFMNRVTQALTDIAEALELRASHDDIVVRFYQHISYVS